MCDLAIEVYRTAVEMGSLAAQDCPVCLVQLGLVTAADDTGVHHPVNPDVAEAVTLAPMNEKVTGQLRAISIAAEAYDDARRARRSATESVGLRLVEGQERINALIDDSVRSCAQQLRTAQPGGGRPSATLEKVQARNMELLNRGVRQRTLYQHGARTDSVTRTYMRELIDRGAEFRTTVEGFQRLIMCDDEVAFVPPSPEARGQCLVVTDKGMLWYLARVFEHTWERAQPVSTVEQRQPAEIVSSLEQRIMEFLVRGYTEDSIARRLGMSRRTIATYISRMSTRLGTSSRAELGYVIARRGLVDALVDDPSPDEVDPEAEP